MNKVKWADEKFEDEEKIEAVKRFTDSIFETDEPSVSFRAAAEFEEEARELVKNWGTYQGLQTGIRAIDCLTKGLVGGELIIVAGETSHGKTLTAINMATKLAEKGNSVLFVTLEMTWPQMTARIMKTTDKDLGSLPIIFQDKDELNWKDVDRLIGDAVKEGVQCVFVDHLHYFSRELEKVSEDLGRITKEFKKNAIRHNVPIVLISHVRKKHAGQKTAASNDELRGSSYIAQDADIVLFVNRESETKTVITITKNRNRGFNPDHASSPVEIEEGARIKTPRGSTILHGGATSIQEIFPQDNHKSD